MGDATPGSNPDAVVLYDESGQPLGTASNPVFTVPASLLGRLRTGIARPGFTMAVDALNAAHYYLAEAPQGTAESATGWSGARIAKDAITGTPMGAWQFSTGFVWNDRVSATWT